jgi:hypothetical protein
MKLSDCTGDISQIKYLSKRYNEIFVEKECFVETVINSKLNAYQRAEAEAKLCLITGELKATDAKIHVLMFGGVQGIEGEAMPLMWQVRTRQQDELRSVWNTMNRKVDELSSMLKQERIINDSLVRKLGGYKGLITRNKNNR